ncbi:MAG TPA: nucleotidyltransferase family protein, partial [Gemmatimonadaceae bacterium]|nr:nucleotidyltransferase family protein [Gemmatimonadaceae bacterium]
MPPIAGVVLAAGGSSRFTAGESGPGHKLLASLGGKPLVRWAVERMVASPVSTTVVVLGRDAPLVERALAGLRVRCVVNDRWAEGMSTSLHAAIRAVREDGVRAAVVALGDQPLVPAGVVERLVHAFRASGAPVVVPVYDGGVRGHPVLFADNIFPELLAVTGDEGARGVIARAPSRVTTVAVPGKAPRDVDGEEDLEAVRQEVQGL